MRRIVLTVLVSFAAFLPAAPARAADAAPRAFFVNIKDGDVVASPVKILFGVTGMAVAPAETAAPGTGHFHLLIDASLMPEQMEFAIPNDTRHLHYGKGQTETVVPLPPGKHKLQIVMGDGGHVPHKPPVMSAPITVIVK